jgi:hypothetical protein
MDYSQLGGRRVYWVYQIALEYITEHNVIESNECKDQVEK